MFDPESLALYPSQSGVYLMKDSSGLVLYVGKGKNLRQRLKNYFAARPDKREMVPFLIAQVATIDTIVTLTEKEALLLENQLIKKHKPKYNVLLKDDKSFISLVLTKHEWPMLRLIRFKETPSKKVGELFGPYTNATAARQTFDLISRLFPLRQCSDEELARRTRPCLLYDIKRCVAPCVHKCTKEEYADLVSHVGRFLRGEKKEILSDLKNKMEAAAEILEFEKADQYLKVIRQIEHVTEAQIIEQPAVKNADVITLYREADAVLISELIFREGRLMASEHYSFHQVISSDEETIESFLIQHYTHHLAPPAEILLENELPSAKILEELLNIKIHAPKRAAKRKLVEMGLKNAKALFVREQDLKSLKEKMLLELAEILQLNRFPKIIECFDTSHISGSDPVASVTCFVNGEKDRSRTRLFKIKNKGMGDDLAAMKEVLLRHFAKQKEENRFCDLLIVDGGKNHLHMAMQVFGELDIASVDLVALAKEESRHDKGLTQEQIFVPHRKDPILVDPKSPFLFLLQRIRDEAHRQAITFHKKRRSKRVIHSSLDAIPGIGPVKKKRLLTHFGSVAQIKAASIEELKKVKGLSKKDLETLHNYLTK